MSIIKEPKNFRFGRFKNNQTDHIRVGKAPAQGEAKAAMIIVTGYRESIEKYFEVINEMTERGVSVWIMDWYGQGGSTRFDKKDPLKMDSFDFDNHVTTLDVFVKKVKKELSEGEKKPLILMAHSMGGNIATRYLHDYKNVFDAAVLTAPMFGLGMNFMMKKVSKALIEFAKTTGNLSSYVPGEKKSKKSTDMYEGNELTSDKARHDAIRKIYVENPEIDMGGLTYRWLNETFKSIKVVNQPNYLEEIETPILMQISGRDTVLDVDAQKAAAKRLPNCTQRYVAGTKHEIWYERDGFRVLMLDAFDKFLGDLLQKHSYNLKGPKNQSPQ